MKYLRLFDDLTDYQNNKDSNTMVAHCIDNNLCVYNGGYLVGNSFYTGHVDEQGLKSIGWTDEDIAYYLSTGVNWNKEDDEYHKVSDANKALYGVLTASNISTYKELIVYLPKIDTSGITNLNNLCNGCVSLIAVPCIDTSSALYMSSMFAGCTSLVSVPLLDTSNVINMNLMFSNCKTIRTIPLFNTEKVINMEFMFNGCTSLFIFPNLNTDLNTKVKYMFNGCNSLSSSHIIDFTGVTDTTSMFGTCNSLVNARIKNIAISVSFNNSPLLSKESLLYIIDNEASTGAITITLSSSAYTRLAEDSDVLTALTNHPNISIAQ